MTDQERLECIYAIFSQYRYYKAETNNKFSRSVRNVCKEAGLTTSGIFEFYLQSPSADILHRANLLYNETIDKLRYSEFYNENTIKEFMRKFIVLGEKTRLAEDDEDLEPEYYWTDEMDNQVEILSKSIEKIKIKLYKNSDSTTRQIDDLRRDLKKSQALYNILYNRQHQFDHFTVEEIASRIYSRYLYNNTIYDVNMKQLKGLPTIILDFIAHIVRLNSITETQIRELSHTSPWIHIHKTTESSIYHDVSLSNQVLRLTQFTRWYEFIREVPGTDELPKPSDKVIDDDDMLDGWYLLYLESLKNNKEKKMIESGHFSSENFIMCTAEEADDIWQRNSMVAKGVMRARAKQIFGSGDKGIRDRDLADIKFEAGMQANKNANAAMKAQMNKK